METSRSIVVLACVAISSACTARESPAEDEQGGSESGSADGESTAMQSATGSADEDDDESGPSLPPETGVDETGYDEYGEGPGEPTTTGGVRDCEDPTDILQFDGVTPSGFEQCADGFIQKTVQATCIVPPAPEACEGDGECSTSAECDEFPNGACIDRPGLDGCGCMYACVEHTDCGEGSLCVCTGIEGIPWPTCVAAPECDDPVDCPYSACGLDIRQQGCGDYEHELACWSPSSECRVDDECEPEPSCADVVEAPPCEIVGGQWTCNEKSSDLCGDCG